MLIGKIGFPVDSLTRHIIFREVLEVGRSLPRFDTETATYKWSCDIGCHHAAETRGGLGIARYIRRCPPP